MGVTTSYLALSNNTSAVLSIEGSYEISKLASTTLKNQRFKNITLLNGTFEEVLPNVLKNSHQSWDFVFLDGNHRYIATKEYFNQILPYLNENSIVVLDDIHWSKEMEKAWKEIYTLKEITLSIDLFFMGIVFFNKNLTKQHFNIRFNPFF